MFTHEHVASISRMYALYCQVEKEKTLQKKIEFKKIVYFAQKKHSFDLEIDSRRISWETTNCIGLALISCRAVVDLNPFSTINSRLVDEFGATCLSMDKTNKNNETPLPMHVTYDSDPIAAEAAARMWYPKYTFKKIIDAVKRTVALEYVEQGQMGELAARLIVLNAIDMAISDSNGDKIEGFCYLKQITVREFLVRFIDVDVIESIEKNRTVRFLNI